MHHLVIVVVFVGTGYLELLRVAFCYILSLVFLFAYEFLRVAVSSPRFIIILECGFFERF